jgi:cathepsin F
MRFLAATLASATTRGSWTYDCPTEGIFAEPCQKAKEVYEKFEKFEKKFQKAYENEAIRLERFYIFSENFLIAKQHQENDKGGAQYDVLSSLGDWSRKEFKARNTLKDHNEFKKSIENKPKFEGSNTTDIPKSFDWRHHDYKVVNKVKDQAQCGSCWAFATVANVEGVHAHFNKELLSLSEQELVSCDPTDNGCGGGLPSNAYQWLITKHRGLELEKDYKYDGVDEDCALDASKQRVFVMDFIAIPENAEDKMAQALVKYGPLSLGLNADPLQFYMGGVMDPSQEECDPAGMDHAVVPVGYGTENSQDYWIIRNSWGEGWGEKGYFRMSRGKNTCGLAAMVTTATKTGKKSVEEMEENYETENVDEIPEIPEQEFVA